MSLKKDLSSRQILVITVVAAVLLILLVVPFSLKTEVPSVSVESVESRIQPVAQLAVQAVSVVTDGKPKDGATVYNTVCAACHSTGVAGAPKSGDKAAWGPRIAQGKEVLYKSALNGKNGMPAKGGAMTLSDAEVKAGVDHLIGLSK